MNTHSIDRELGHLLLKYGSDALFTSLLAHVECLEDGVYNSKDEERLRGALTSLERAHRLVLDVEVSGITLVDAHDVLTEDDACEDLRGIADAP